MKTLKLSASDIIEAFVRKWNDNALVRFAVLSALLEEHGYEVGELVTPNPDKAEWLMTVQAGSRRSPQSGWDEVVVTLSFNNIVGDEKGLFWPQLDMVTMDGKEVGSIVLSREPMYLEDDERVSDAISMVAYKAREALEAINEHFEILSPHRSGEWPKGGFRRWKIIQFTPIGTHHSSIHTREEHAKEEVENLLRTILPKAREWASQNRNNRVMVDVQRAYEALDRGDIWRAYDIWLELQEFEISQIEDSADMWSIGGFVVTVS